MFVLVVSVGLEWIILPLRIFVQTKYIFETNLFDVLLHSYKGRCNSAMNLLNCNNFKNWVKSRVKVK